MKLRLSVLMIPLTVSGLSGCMTSADRAALDDANNKAQTAMERAMSAEAEAHQAHQAADEAAAAARASSQRADRIFQQNQGNK